MAFTGIDHIVLLVEDIEAGIATWRRLGLTLTHRVDVEAIGLRQAFFSLDDGSFIELIAPAHARSVVSRALASNGEGLHTLALGVEDLDTMVDTLVDRQVDVVGTGTPQVFIHPRAATGVRIQLWSNDRPHRWRDAPSEAGTTL